MKLDYQPWGSVRMLAPCRFPQVPFFLQGTLSIPRQLMALIIGGQGVPLGRNPPEQVISGWLPGLMISHHVLLFSMAFPF